MIGQYLSNTNESTTVLNTDSQPSSKQGHASVQCSHILTVKSRAQHQRLVWSRTAASARAATTVWPRQQHDHTPTPKPPWHCRTFTAPCTSTMICNAAYAITNFRSRVRIPTCTKVTTAFHDPGAAGVGLHGHRLGCGPHRSSAILSIDAPIAVETLGRRGDE